MYLVLVPRSMHPGTRRRQIKMVWEWSGESLPNAPVELEEALKEGILHPGNGLQHAQMARVPFFRQVHGSLEGPGGTRDREARLADPWAFGKWLLDQDESGNRQLRHILCYLLFPGHFEAAATNYQKRLIVKAFRTERGLNPDDIDYGDMIAVDRELRMVRERQVGDGAAPNFSFFDDARREIWQPASRTSSVAIKPQGAG